MSPATRRLSRTGRMTSHADGLNTPRGPQTTIEPPSFPKHFPFPSSNSMSDLYFDFLLAVYASVGAGLQFLYLYRSVWWLENSYTRTTMNFYLIDPNLVVLIVVVFLRRLYYQVGCKLISKLYSNKTEEDLNCFSRCTLFLFYAMIIGVLATIVLGNRGKMDVVYLFYPFTLYIPIFGFKIQPFFEVSNWCSNGIHPIHACSSNPIEIRKECELLKCNLLDRLRQIFFTASVNAYYGSFIPCCFSQPELVYDRWWNIEHGVFIFLGSIFFSFSHMIPLWYCDILHKAVLHSGSWERLDNDCDASALAAATTIHEWRDDALWFTDSIVKCNKMIWRAKGPCNCIIPGDKSFSWGYQLFIVPWYPISVAATIQATLILYQIHCLLHADYWYRIITLGIMCMFNYYAFFKLLRDSMIGYRTYTTDDNEEEKDDFGKLAFEGLMGGLQQPSQTRKPHYRPTKTRNEEITILTAQDDSAEADTR